LPHQAPDIHQYGLGRGPLRTTPLNRRERFVHPKLALERDHCTVTDIVALVLERHQSPTFRGIGTFNNVL